MPDYKENDMYSTKFITNLSKGVEESVNSQCKEENKK